MLKALQLEVETGRKYGLLRGPLLNVNFDKVGGLERLSALLFFVTHFDL